ncbi:hypothetical protein FS837_009249 [Tulasnella sp. UAMH 9824]|nr:hypothetical protein FS837_009249 [Tulasnella sp. UAMH 9824]
MSGEEEFVRNSVAAYFALCANQPTSNIVLDDSGLVTESAKDGMIKVLACIQDVFAREVFRLKTRRNNEHSIIHQLPPELFVEILLLAVHWEWWDTEKLRNLASVSTSWRDAILSCNRFWPVIDVMGNKEARRMAMKRNPRGPVDVWCWAHPDPTAMQEFMQDITTVPGNRWRSVLYEHRPETQAFLSHLQTQTSGLIDILIFNPVFSQEETITLDLSSEGPCLRHAEIWGMGLPNWQSPRLTGLVTLSLGNMHHGAPRPEHLYTILSSSPRLERLSVANLTPIDTNSSSFPTAPPPITLPVLTALAFRSVSSSITRAIVPLIRATSCKTVVVTSFRLPPEETTLELLAQPITVSESLKLELKMEGEPCIHVRSEPNISHRWAYWAFDDPGVDVKLAVPSAGGLARVWNQLDMVLGSHGKASNITTLEIEWSMDVWGEDLPSTFGLFRFCPKLTVLRWTDNTGKTLRSLVRLLRRREEMEEDTRRGISPWPLPRLHHLGYHASAMVDVDACAADIKTFFELRYPFHAENNSTTQSFEDPTPVTRLDLPSRLVAKLKSMDILTYLKLGDVLQIIN